MSNNSSIYIGFKEKFSENLEKSLACINPKLEEAELKAQAIYHFGIEIDKFADDQTRKHIATIFKEIFSDLSISIYLGLCSIDNPSKVILRRVLELGIAIPVFWDLPYKFWGWKDINAYETDLNFKDNLEYLGSLSYKTYLKNEFQIDKELICKEVVNKVYRELSNTIHGKYNSFETTIQNAYCYDKQELENILLRIIECENILLNCFVVRFENVMKEVIKILPGLERYKYEY